MKTYKIVDGTDIMMDKSPLQQFARVDSEYHTWPRGTSLALLLLFPAEVSFTLLAEKGGRAASRGTWSWGYTPPGKLTAAWSPVMFSTLLPQGALGPVASLPSSTQVLESLTTTADSYFLRDLEELNIEDTHENWKYVCRNVAVWGGLCFEQQTINILNKSYSPENQVIGVENSLMTWIWPTLEALATEQELRDIAEGLVRRSMESPFLVHCMGARKQDLPILLEALGRWELSRNGGPPPPRPPGSSSARRAASFPFEEHVTGPAQEEFGDPLLGWADQHLEDSVRALQPLIDLARSRPLQGLSRIPPGRVWKEATTQYTELFGDGDLMGKLRLPDALILSLTPQGWLDGISQRRLNNLFRTRRLVVWAGGWGDTRTPVLPDSLAAHPVLFLYSRTRRYGAHPQGSDRRRERDPVQRDGTFRDTTEGVATDVPLIREARSQDKVRHACDGPVDWAMVMTGADRIWGLLRGAQDYGDEDPTSFRASSNLAPFFLGESAGNSLLKALTAAFQVTLWHPTEGRLRRRLDEMNEPQVVPMRFKRAFFLASYLPDSLWPPWSWALFQ